MKRRLESSLVQLTKQNTMTCRAVGSGGRWEERKGVNTPGVSDIPEEAERHTDQGETSAKSLLSGEDSHFTSCATR